MDTPRVLSISTGTREVGYAYFEGEKLIDWGVRENIVGDLSERVTKIGLKHIRALIKRYEPEVLILPSPERHKPNQKKFVETIESEFQSDELVIERLSRYDVRDCFASMTHVERITKQDVMVELARRYTDLQSRVPKPRRSWDPPDWWAPMFEAAARAVTWITKS